MRACFRMMELYGKLEAAVLQLDYFTQNHWDVSVGALMIVVVFVVVVVLFVFL